MTERAKQISDAADRQVTELIDLLSTLDQAALERPCPGREKLGDGTIGAAARHTAENYQRIASFVQATDRVSAAIQPARDGRHRIPKFLRTLGHGREDHAGHAPTAGQHTDAYTANSIDVETLVKQLTACRDALAQIAELTEGQLDAIPPKDSFRFCDGQRTLEQVLAGLLKHQAHQLEALCTAA